MLRLPDKFVLMDTEYTSWEGALERNWKGKNEYKEIVAIGSIIVDGKTLSEENYQIIFVKPVKNPRLSDFFVNFTKITQDKVDREGVSLERAIDLFLEWKGELPVFSFGPDLDIIKDNCKLIDIDFIFNENMFFDIRDVFEKKGISMKGFTSGTITRSLGEKEKRISHNPLNDVRSILDGLKLLNEKVI